MKILLLFIGSVVLLAGGCGTNSLGGSAFDSAGMPQNRYYIGGGAAIEYKAPKAGTLYLVEANTKTILAMKTLEEAEVFDVNIDVRDEDVHMRLKSLGVDPLNCKFSAYYVPVD